MKPPSLGVYKKPFWIRVVKATISGIRGVVGTELGPREVSRFCGNFAAMIPGRCCVLGRDTRPSGEVLARAAAAALMAGGLDVVDMGVAPTPAVFWEARRRGAGVVVTASHNPPQWNGLKFIIDGRGASHSAMRDISGNVPPAPPRYGNHTYVTSGYVEAAGRIIGNVSKTPSILVDAGGGAATEMAPHLLRSLGCHVGMIHNTTPRPDPTAGGLDELAARSTEYDAGVAFDMDGDRVVVVIDGVVQPPDATLGLGVAAAMERGHRNFVFSVDTSSMVERYVIQRGGTVSRCGVGEANVVDMMLRRGAGAGGEGSSGGFILGEFNWCRDGMLAAGLLASMVSEDVVRHTINEVTGSTIIREKIQCDGALSDVIGYVEEISEETDDTDGVRGMMGQDSWVLVRPSNTEDVLRVSVEGTNPERCKSIISEISRRVGNGIRA